jgi:hypothetical protein
MKQFTAEYSKRGQYGISICTADTIEELIQILSDRGYEFRVGEKGKILNWSNTTQKKYYSVGLNIRRGELEMTEYTSF